MRKKLKPSDGAGAYVDDCGGGAIVNLRCCTTIQRQRAKRKGNKWL